jgi:aldose 1-epimerase
VPDAQGRASNIALGYETFQEYLEDPFFIGATVGRVANRIAGGRFELEGREFELECNNGEHHLHGGSDGWSKRLWEAQAGLADGFPTVVFSRVSPDGESGYPGKIEASVTYQLLNEGLRILMSGASDAKTLLNLAHHSYFNLRGEGEVLDHELRLACSRFTPGAPDVPDGTVAEVDGTPLDFRKQKRIGTELPKSASAPPGFDHNLLIDAASEAAGENSETELRPVAFVREPTSGRTMELLSNQPAVQLYTGNYLDGRKTSSGALGQYGGVCLETQAVPNTIATEAFRDQVILSPGEIYRHEMLFRFVAEKL